MKAKPESSTKPEDRIRLAYRLLFILDDALRTLMKRRGELSRYVLEALESAAFEKMPLVGINLEIKAPEVNIFMPTSLYQKKTRAAAEKRDVSLHVIVNSAWRSGCRNGGWSRSIPSSQYINRDVDTTIPEWCASGDLPPGIHFAAWAWIEER